MTTLTREQIKQLLMQYTGWRGADLETATAIALAESGGNTMAYNPELASSYSRPGAGSRGLFQIFGAVHPQYNSDAAYDPTVNARGAYEIYKQAGNSFTPWSAYTAGTYKNYLGQSSSPVQTLTPQSLPTFTTLSTGLVRSAPTAQTTQTAQGGGSFFGIDPGKTAAVVTQSIGNTILGKTSSGVQRTTTDLFFFLIGAALVFIGLLALFLKTESGQRVVSVGGEAVKLAAVGAL